MLTNAPVGGPERIVVVQSAYLGDLILTTPLLRELRRIAPHAELSVVVAPRAAALAPCLPAADRVLSWRKRAGIYGLRELWRTGRALAADRFDLAIAAQRSIRSGLALSLGRVPRRIGFAGSQGAWTYHQRVPWRAERHAARRLLDLAIPLDPSAAGADPRPSLSVPHEAESSAAAKLAALGVADGAPLVAIAPGSAWPTKRWTEDGFAAVARAAARAGVVPVLVGSPEEAAACERIRASAGGGAVVAAGQLTLPETVAVVRRSEVAVGNDSAIPHIAAAVGTAVVAVFGPTVPEQGSAPRGERVEIVGLPGLACRPCGRHGGRRCPLEHHRCMRDLRPEPVVDAMLRCIAGRGGQVLPG